MLPHFAVAVQGMGGSCTGEHGIGHGKLHLLEREHGMPALQVGWAHW